MTTLPGTISLIRGDARNLPLPDASVDLIVTSPPYWKLRQYIDGGQAYEGQLGSEHTPAEYIANLLACTAEWTRVLKPGGSIWVNLGDKYARTGGADIRPRTLRRAGAGTHLRAATTTGDIPEKSLIGLPWRYALGCIDDLGLTLRAEVIWNKPNAMPESVNDRVRRSHEQWFHLVTSPRYYSAVDAIRQPHTMRPQRRPNGRPKDLTPRPDQPRQGWSTAKRDEPGVDGHPLGALPGSVWSICTQPLPKPPAELDIKHYAAYPLDLPHQIIAGWSPPGICTECGEGRRLVVEKPGLLGGDNNPDSRNGTRRRSTMDGGHAEWARRIATPDRITGHTCSCPDTSAPARPATVLDPFGGTGTTSLMAAALGRHGISIDMSDDYCRLAAWRTTDPKQIARALATPAKQSKPRPPKTASARKPTQPAPPPATTAPWDVPLFDLP